MCYVACKQVVPTFTTTLDTNHSKTYLLQYDFSFYALVTNDSQTLNKS